MEVVRAFNNELSSLYECKPPISKAKMTQVTKAAIKGIKFYKHIVQSVEKFVQKCRPEYKVPGLYVIDSIVRQSRHQFGCEKDVFAPRFTKNITMTFQNLFKCPSEDRPKIVRVLNLWQKNNVFPSEVIQPLLDMANPNAPVFQQSPPSGNATTNSLPKHKGMDSSPWKTWSQANQLLEGSAKERQLPINTEASMIIDEPNKYKDEDSSHLAVDSGLITRLQELAGQLLVSKPEETRAEESTVKFNKKLLDFDYSDEEEDEEEKDDNEANAEPNELALSMAQNLLSNPELLRQLQQMQQTIQQTEAFKSELTSQDQFQRQQHLKHEEYSQPLIEDSSVSMQSIPFPEEQPPEPMIPPYTNSSVVYSGQQPSTPITDDVDSMPSQEMFRNSVIDLPPAPDVDERFGVGLEGPLSLQDMDLRPKIISESIKEDRDTEKNIRSRSRSGSRSRTRASRKHSHRSRSRSPRRKRSRSRSGSRSRSRHRREKYSRSRSREREREKEREKERERERRRKGLPPIKKSHVGVCSTTLWFGHLQKTVAEIDLQETLSEFGPIRSIDMILPRGCAFVCMEKRQDANKALQKLKNLKLQGCNVKIAWAPGKGVKEKEYKSYWDVELGVSYIPFDKLPSESELEVFEEGSMIDEDSLPEKYREYRKQREKAKQVALEAAKHLITLQPPVMPRANINPVAASAGGIPNMNNIPSTLPMPMMVPPLVQNHQYGIPMPGLMHPQHMVMPPPVPMGVPPPNPMLMVPPTSQPILGPLPVMPPIPSGPVGMPPNIPGPHISTTSLIPSTITITSSSASTQPAGDATPTEEDGTSAIVTTNTVQSSITSTLQSIPATLPPIGTLPSLSQPPFSISMPFNMPPTIPHSNSSSLPYPPPPGMNFPSPNRPPMQPQPPTIPTTPQHWKPPNSGYNDSDMRYSAPPPNTVSPNIPSSITGTMPPRHPVGFNLGPPQTNSDNNPMPHTPLPDRNINLQGRMDGPSSNEGNKFGSQNSQEGQPDFGPFHGPMRGPPPPLLRSPLISPTKRPLLNTIVPPHSDSMSSEQNRGPDLYRGEMRDDLSDGYRNQHQDMMPRVDNSQEGPGRPFLLSRGRGIPMGDGRRGRGRGPIFTRNFGARGRHQNSMQRGGTAGGSRGQSQDNMRRGASRRPMRSSFGRGGPRGRGNIQRPGQRDNEDNAGNFRPPQQRWNDPEPFENYNKPDIDDQNIPEFQERREFFDGSQSFGRGEFRGRFMGNRGRNMDRSRPPNRRFGNKPWPHEERDWHRVQHEIYFGNPNDKEPEDWPDKEQNFAENRFPIWNRGFNDQNNRNYNDQNNRGFNDHNRGFNDQNNRGFNDQNNRGFNDQNTRGFGDQNKRGINGPNNRGFNDQSNRDNQDRHNFSRKSFKDFNDKQDKSNLQGPDELKNKSQEKTEKSEPTKIETKETIAPVIDSGKKQNDEAKENTAAKSETETDG